VLSAALPEIPLELLRQLKPGGILIAPVGSQNPLETESQHLVKIVQTADGPVREKLIPVAFVPMIPGLPQELRKPDEPQNRR
jgi:protein-L-isoaspartate(D-aspartate) O-methyltransferase